MEKLNESEVEALYRSGIEAIIAIAGRISPEDWEQPACGVWSASDTARHLLGVANWYHDWLDRSLVGESDPPFAEAEFESRNQARIDQLIGTDGPSAIEQFTIRASTYLERALPHRHLPFGFPAGTITVGLHIGVAATEWHLHAWDLSANSTGRHQPDSPQQLFSAAGLAMAKAKAKGGWQGRLLNLAVPLAARRAPWKKLLKESGRS